MHFSNNSFIHVCMVVMRSWNVYIRIINLTIYFYRCKTHTRLPHAMYMLLRTRPTSLTITKIPFNGARGCSRTTVRPSVYSQVLKFPSFTSCLLLPFLPFHLFIGPLSTPESLCVPLHHTSGPHRISLSLSFYPSPSTSAPLSSSSTVFLQTPPAPTALCRGVSPKISFACKFAPLSSSSCTTSIAVLPLPQA
jgi:hypothetical protein